MDVKIIPKGTFWLVRGSNPWGGTRLPENPFPPPHPSKKYCLSFTSNYLLLHYNLLLSFEWLLFFSFCQFSELCLYYKRKFFYVWKTASEHEHELSREWESASCLTVSATVVRVASVADLEKAPSSTCSPNHSFSLSWQGARHSFCCFLPGYYTYITQH